MAIRDNIKNLRDRDGLTQQQLADKLGVTRATVTQWETGWSQPRMGMVEKLASVFNVPLANIVDNSDTLLSTLPVISGVSATVPIRVLGKVHAGDFGEEEVFDDIVEIPASLHEAHKRAFALLIEGGCVNREAPEGEYAVIDPDMTPQNGSFVVAELEGYDAILRQWFIHGNKLMLATYSFSDEYEDFIFDANDYEGSVKVLGVMFWHQAGSELE